MEKVVESYGISKAQKSSNPVLSLFLYFCLIYQGIFTSREGRAVK